MLHQIGKKILKKLLGGFIAASVLAASAVGGSVVFAREESNGLSVKISTVTFGGTIDYLKGGDSTLPLSLKPGNTFEGTSYFTQLDDVSADLYELFYTEYENGGHSGDIELINILKKHDQYVYGNTEDMQTALASNAYTAILALSADHPELSWVTHAKYGVSMSYKDGTKKELTKAVFHLTDGYGYGTPAEITKAVTEAKKKIDAQTENSGYGLVKSIHDYICNLTDYNDKAASLGGSTADYDIGWYQTAYSAFYPIGSNGDTENRTVCAGYSNAFKLLCDCYGIPCVTVRGTDNTKGNHMWNYVKMDDGYWYAVDATWDDQTESSQKIFYDYFLVGGNSAATDFDNLTFNESHLNSGYWDAQKSYLFSYPNLASEKYVPAADPDPEPTPTPEPEPTPNPGEGKINLTDEKNNTGIVISADEGVLDKDTVLNVEEKQPDPEKPNRVTYDITLTLNGENVQPNGEVTVKIPVPEAFAGKKCRVYYIEVKDGAENPIDMNAVIEDRFLVFTAEHFSEYVVAYDDNPPIILGDVDGSGTINDRDSIQLDRYLAEWDNEIDIAAADFNTDGKVNDRDSIALARTLAGWYE